MQCPAEPLQSASATAFGYAARGGVGPVYLNPRQKPPFMHKISQRPISIRVPGQLPPGISGRIPAPGSVDVGDAGKATAIPTRGQPVSFAWSWNGWLTR